MINGAIVVDKPKGLTSRNVLDRVIKSLKINKAGHTGTLDPFATGVLPICFNNATKLIPYIDESLKSYTGVIHLGITTDTMDCTGTVLSVKDVGQLKKADIIDAFSKFTGSIKQIPPMYSAVKRNGKRLYKLARSGKEVYRKPRTVFIKKFELDDFSPPLARFTVRCSKGTYVRVIASDIGDYLRCGAYLMELRRVSSGIFSIDDSSTLDDVENNRYKIRDSCQLVCHLPSFSVNFAVSNLIRNGSPLLKRHVDCELPFFKKNDKVVLKYNGSVLSIMKSLCDSDKIKNCSDDSEILKILRVIN